MDNQIKTMLPQSSVNRFYGHDTLFSKYTPQIPAQAEREYIRLTNSYMELLKDELEKELPKIKVIYKENRDKDADSGIHTDSIDDLEIAITTVINTIAHNLQEKILKFSLFQKLEAMANLNRKLTVREWKKAVKATLGINIREDYYLGNFYADQLEKWVSENVDLIKTIPKDTLDKMKDIIYDGYSHGRSTTRMVRDIQRAYGVSKRKAQAIARDQTAKLNGEIQRFQQMDAGIESYTWCTCGDERVRESHRALNGKIFSWNEPPLNSDGRRCHPGEDYNCRCIGRPVFKKIGMNLPIEDDNTGEINLII